MPERLQGGGVERRLTTSASRRDYLYYVTDLALTATLTSDPGGH